MDKLYPDTSSGNSSDGINFWKGRKIIPLDKWLKITRANTISNSRDYNVKEGLQYFPDDYFASMFPLGIPEDLKEEADKWYFDYIELMEYRKNPRIGRTKCFRCLLSPDMEESALFIGINKVIARSLVEDKEESNNSKKDDNNNNIASSTSTTSTQTSIYPCKVLNRYACPYDNKGGKIKADVNFDVDGLFALYKIAFQVELAFSHAYSMSKSNETIYEADFETGKVRETTSLYNGSPHSWSTDYQIEEKLSQVQKLSKVPIRNVQDVYNALTDKDTFDRLLQQGLEGEYQQYNDQILEFFMNIKDRISIEDLRVYEPIWTLKIEKGKCSICNEFANIHCVNCKDTIWLCVDHWGYHKKDIHTSTI